MSTEKSKSENIVGIAQDEDRSDLRHAVNNEQTRLFVIEAARMMAQTHCEDVVVFDVRTLSDVTDYIIIASGTSDRQMKSVADDVEELAEKINLTRYGKDVDGTTTWIVVDFVDVVVHLFEPATRSHYDLEMMWDDAPRISWQSESKD